ncbi:MAG TPA: iron dicitrate transport regulator FecR [Burkholderiales bacterium]|nr:iron dicitrate transport regulator FecR [Burkholderiales bacterium]
MDAADRSVRARLGRRAFVRALGAGPVLALLGPLPARGQGSDQIRDLKGDVRVNGRPADRKSVIRPGDTIATGSDGYVVFVLGQDAFMLRGRSELKLEGGASSVLVDALRLVTGALGAVFARGRSRTIYAPTATAGIRGTGVYLEARSEGTYFCTCYGAVSLAAADDAQAREFTLAGRHTARIVSPRGAGAPRLTPAPFEGHTDAEMDALERAVGRRSPLITPR